MNDAVTQELREAAPETAPSTEENGWDWAIVEIFGHRRHAGRVREEERFGAKMLRVDMPIKGDAAANGYETHYYGGASIFSYTPTTEEAVIRINTPYAAPSRYQLPKPGDDDPNVDVDGGDHDDDPF